MLNWIGSLFQIKHRWEVWPAIYAISVGSVERGERYLHTYHGVGGWLLFLACTAIVFVVGGKLLDSVPQSG